MVGILPQYFIKIMFQAFKKFDHYSMHTLHFQNVLEYYFKHKLCLIKIEITSMFFNDGSSTYKV
jgi:hypothetical protein